MVRVAWQAGCDGAAAMAGVADRSPLTFRRPSGDLELQEDEEVGDQKSRQL